jgi:hypothetical protein
MVECVMWRLVVLGLVGWLVGWVNAGTIEKKFPDGTLQLKYETDDKAVKNGSWEEYYPSGQSKVKASYKADKLNGPYKSYHENGKPHITATYKDGRLTGAYTEENPQGQKKLTATYKDGKLNGQLIRFDKGKPVVTETHKDGVLAYPRSQSEMKTSLAAIFNAPFKPGSDVEAETALRRLKAARYLAEVPYEDLELDPELTKAAQAAAAICLKLGKLDHDPPNPGLPEKEYQLALLGAKNSNLGAGYKSLADSVDRWLFDSDPANIERLGHRRSSLNPAMQKLGFGKVGSVTAMWSHDSSRKEIPDFDFVAFPARGTMPIEFFGPTHAWCVSLNPKKYQPPTGVIQPKLYALDAQLNKVGGPLQLADVRITGQGAGLPQCIIFRPDPAVIGPGRRFKVEIDGLTRTDAQPGPLSYCVEFVVLR